MTRVTTKALLFALVTTFISVSHSDDDRLMAVLDARTPEASARDAYRHPAETLKLFGIKEGMTVIDALPGGWYGGILAPLLGPEGTYIGVRYGEWFYKNRYPDDYEKRWTDAQSFLTEWPANVAEYSGGQDGPEAVAHFFPGLPESLDDSVDAVLFFRALHHTNRFGPKYLDMTATDAFRVLKSGGVVGVVQHRAPEDADDTWASGSKGYLKQSRVIAAFKAAGFVLDNASEINANRKDQPTTEDFVWRLPPSSDKPEAVAIGESDRMTLVFKKP